MAVESLGPCRFDQLTYSTLKTRMLTLRLAALEADTSDKCVLHFTGVYTDTVLMILRLTLG